MAQQTAKKLADFYEIRGNASFDSGNGLVTLAFDSAARSVVPAQIDLSGYASQSYVDDAITSLIDTAPGTLDTLNELAAALGDDANFAATVTTALATKITQTDGDARYLQLSGGTVSGDVAINPDPLSSGQPLTISATNRFLTLNRPASDSTYMALKFQSGGVDDWFVGTGGFSTDADFHISSYAGGTMFTAKRDGSSVDSIKQHRFQHLGSATNDSTQAALLIKPSGTIAANYQALRIEGSGSTDAVFSVDGTGSVLMGQLTSFRLGDATGFGTAKVEVTAGTNTFPAVFKGNNIGVMIHVPSYEEGRGMLTLYGNSKTLRIDANTKMEWADLAIGTFDTNLYRESAGVLKTDGTLSAAGATFNGSAAVTETTGDARYLQLTGGTLTGNLKVGSWTSGDAGAAREIAMDGRYNQHAFYTTEGLLRLTNTGYGNTLEIHAGYGNADTRYVSSLNLHRFANPVTVDGSMAAVRGAFSHLGSATNDSTQAALLIKPSGTIAANYQALRIEGSGSTDAVFSVDGSGNVVANSLYFTGDETTGFYQVAPGTLSFQSEGATQWLAAALTANGSYPRSLRVRSDMMLGWASGNPDVVVEDVAIVRAGAGVLKIIDGASGLGSLRMASLGINNSVVATTPGTVTRKMEIFDESGASLGFVAIYDSIT